MNRTIQMAGGFILAAIMSACSPSQPPSGPEPAQPAEYMSDPPPPAEPSLPVAAPEPAASAANTTLSGSMVVYVCDDKSGLTVTYDQHGALVKLPSGSTMLSRAEGVANGGDEAYLGEELSLYRNGNMVQLKDAGKSRICTEVPISG